MCEDFSLPTWPLADFKPMSNDVVHVMQLAVHAMQLAVHACLLSICLYYDLYDQRFALAPGPTILFIQGTLTEGEEGSIQLTSSLR